MLGASIGLVHLSCFGSNLLTSSDRNESLRLDPFDRTKELLSLDFDFVGMPMFPCLQSDFFIRYLLALKEQVVPGRIDGGEDFSLSPIHRQHHVKQPVHLFSSISQRFFGPRHQFIELPILRHPITRSLHALEEEVVRHLCPVLYAFKVAKVVRSGCVFYGATS